MLQIQEISLYPMQIIPETDPTIETLACKPALKQINNRDTSL